MRLPKIWMAFAIGTACIAMPLLGQSNPQDAKSNQDRSTAQSSNKDQAPKKDAKTSGDSAQPARPRTPMDGGSATAHNQNGDSITADKNRDDSLKYSTLPFKAANHGSVSGQSAAHDQNVPNWKVKDLGDSVRFEFQTPMGPNVWIKKKSDLNDREKAALANATPAAEPNPASTTATPAATSASPKK
ncbi:MAG: hypothetical protein WA324_04905 [Bryobacteraceae bacterium]